MLMMQRELRLSAVSGGVSRSARCFGCISLRKDDALLVNLVSVTESLHLPTGTRVWFYVYCPKPGEPSRIDDIYRASYDATFEDLRAQWQCSYSSTEAPIAMPDAFQIIATRPDLAHLLRLPCLTLRLAASLPGDDFTILYCNVMIHVHSFRIVAQHGLAHIAKHRAVIKSGDVIRTEFRLVRDSPFSRFEPTDGAAGSSALAMKLRVSKQLKHKDLPPHTTALAEEGYINTKAARTYRERTSIRSVFETWGFCETQNPLAIYNHRFVPRRKNGVAHASWLWNTDELRDNFRAPWTHGAEAPPLDTKFMMIVTSHTRKLGIDDNLRYHSRMFKVLVEETSHAAAPFATPWFFCFSPQAYSSSTKNPDDCPTEISDDEFESNVIDKTSHSTYIPYSPPQESVYHIGHHHQPRSHPAATYATQGPVSQQQQQQLPHPPPHSQQQLLPHPPPHSQQQLLPHHTIQQQMQFAAMQAAQQALENERAREARCAGTINYSTGFVTHTSPATAACFPSAALAASSSTALAASSSTALATSTSTALAASSSTALAASTSTALAASTSTALVPSGISAASGADLAAIVAAQEAARLAIVALDRHEESERARAQQAGAVMRSQTNTRTGYNLRKRKSSRKSVAAAVQDHTQQLVTSLPPPPPPATPPPAQHPRDTFDNLFMPHQPHPFDSPLRITGSGSSVSRPSKRQRLRQLLRMMMEILDEDRSDEEEEHEPAQRRSRGGGAAEPQPPPAHSHQLVTSAAARRVRMAATHMRAAAAATAAAPTGTAPAFAFDAFAMDLVLGSEAANHIRTSTGVSATDLGQLLQDVGDVGHYLQDDD